MGGGPSLPPCLMPGPWASVGPTVEADPPLLPGARGRWGAQGGEPPSCELDPGAPRLPSGVVEPCASGRDSGMRPAQLGSPLCLSCRAGDDEREKSEHDRAVEWDSAFQDKPLPNQADGPSGYRAGWRKDNANPHGRNALSTLPPCPDQSRPAGSRRAGTL